MTLKIFTKKIENYDFLKSFLKIKSETMRIIFYFNYLTNEAQIGRYKGHLYFVFSSKSAEVRKKEIYVFYINFKKMSTELADVRYGGI